MKEATLSILFDEGSKKILLGMKKRGFGTGKFNGFGGKVKEGESVKQAALRELFEECSVMAKDAEKVAELSFYFSNKKEWNQIVHIF